MSGLIAIASKQVQLQEIAACIEHFAVDHASVHLFNHQARISVDAARATLGDNFPGLGLDLSTFDIDDRQAIADILDQPSDIAAFPLYRASAFYRHVPKLRRQGVRIVHVTDGIGDLFSMWDLQRAVLARTNITLLKSAFAIPQLYACRADLEFNLFHPLRTPYAKKGLPVGAFPMTSEKRSLLDVTLKRHAPEALVIDGFDLKADAMADDLGLKRYVATRRDGGLLIDGRLFLEDQIICAEEVLSLMRPHMVVGCPSTSLAAASTLHPGLPVFCLATEEARRVRGARFNDVFRAHTERLGVRFSDAKDLAGQLTDVSQQLPRILCTSA
jgi:hypothetical protein